MDASNSQRVEIDYSLLKQALRDVLGAEGLSGTATIANRFRGGTVVLKPQDPEQQPKEIPVEAFFKKVVRVRDQLRLLEQKVNGHEKLEPEEKRVLQGYITRAYGTLTTFNVLFQDKSDHFVGQKGK